MQVLGSFSLQAHLLSPAFPLCPTNSGLRDGRTLMRHFTTPNRVDPCHALQTLALQSHTTCLTPSPRDHAAVSAHSKASPISLLFFLCLCLCKWCAKTVFPSLSPLFSLFFFPVGCFVLTHQAKTQNMRWEHLALAVEHCREVPRYKISFFPPSS